MPDLWQLCHPNLNLPTVVPKIDSPRDLLEDLIKLTTKEDMWVQSRTAGFSLAEWDLSLHIPLTPIFCPCAEAYAGIGEEYRRANLSRHSLDSTSSVVLPCLMDVHF
jgi:hypothetical protein